MYLLQPIVTQAGSDKISYTSVGPKKTVKRFDLARQVIKLHGKVHAFFVELYGLSKRAETNISITKIAV